MMKTIYRMLLLVSLATVSLNTYSQTYFEWTATSPYFPDGTPNLVSYIDMGDIALWGTVEVTLTGSYTYQNTTGIYKKHYNIGRAVSNAPHSNSSEVVALLGPIGSQWNLGDFEINSSNHLVIPIYHLVSTGNYIRVHIKVFADNSVSSSSFTVTTPTTHSNTPARTYPYTYGKMSIGTSKADDDALLTVAGNINSREVKVKVDAGADFVFDEQYKLPPLSETEKFIKENKHLPEILPAEKMKEQGIGLGEMNIKLLQKIEELTLHLIEQNKNSKAQEIKISQQDQQIKSLVTRLDAIQKEVKK